MKKILLLISITFLLFDCRDTLLEDSDPGSPIKHVPIVLDSHTEVYLDVIRRNKITSAALISIALRPKNGSLRATDTIGVFAYTPDSSFLSGKDSIIFQIQLQSTEATSFDTVRLELY